MLLLDQGGRIVGLFLREQEERKKFLETFYLWDNLKVALDFLSHPRLNLVKQLHLAVRVVVYQIKLGEYITKTKKEKMDIGEN